MDGATMDSLAAMVRGHSQYWNGETVCSWRTAINEQEVGMSTSVVQRSEDTL